MTVPASGSLTPGNKRDGGKISMASNDEDEGRLASLPGELRLILREIEQEQVPARLLELAMELQQALARRRRSNPASGGDTPDSMRG